MNLVDRLLGYLLRLESGNQDAAEAIVAAIDVADAEALRKAYHYFWRGTPTEFAEKYGLNRGNFARWRLENRFTPSTSCSSASGVKRFLRGLVLNSPEPAFRDQPEQQHTSGKCARAVRRSEAPSDWLFRGLRPTLSVEKDFRLPNQSLPSRRCAEETKEGEADANCSSVLRFVSASRPPVVAQVTGQKFPVREGARATTSAEENAHGAGNSSENLRPMTFAVNAREFRPQLGIANPLRVSPRGRVEKELPRPFSSDPEEPEQPRKDSRLFRTTNEKIPTRGNLPQAMLSKMAAYGARVYSTVSPEETAEKCKLAKVVVFVDADNSSWIVGQCDVALSDDCTDVKILSFSAANRFYSEITASCKGKWLVKFHATVSAKNAADVCLGVAFARLDLLLALDVAFVVVSADSFRCELCEHHARQRTVMGVNAAGIPHFGVWLALLMGALGLPPTTRATAAVQEFFAGGDLRSISVGFSPEMVAKATEAYGISFGERAGNNRD